MIDTLMGNDTAMSDVNPDPPSLVMWSYVADATVSVRKFE
jgi:hypothetical protein